MNDFLSAIGLLLKNIMQCCCTNNPKQFVIEVSDYDTENPQANIHPHPNRLDRNTRNMNNPEYSTYFVNTAVVAPMRLEISPRDTHHYQNLNTEYTIEYTPEYINTDHINTEYYMHNEPIHNESIHNEHHHNHSHHNKMYIDINDIYHNNHSHDKNYEVVNTSQHRVNKKHVNFSPIPQNLNKHNYNAINASVITHKDHSLSNSQVKSSPHKSQHRKSFLSVDQYHENSLNKQIPLNSNRSHHQSSQHVSSRHISSKISQRDSRGNQSVNHDSSVDSNIKLGSYYNHSPIELIDKNNFCNINQSYMQSNKTCNIKHFGSNKKYFSPQKEIEYTPTQYPHTVAMMRKKQYTEYLSKAKNEEEFELNSDSESY